MCVAAVRVEGGSGVFVAAPVAVLAAPVAEVENALFFCLEVLDN